jgi:nucleoside-triphosphatase THEP1
MDLPYDADVASAMNRVLEAERAARAAIVDCESKMQVSLEQARQERRTILERAQKLIMALHERAARSLERQTAQILGQHEPPGLVAAQVVDSARLQAAIDHLLERLTGSAEDEL